MIVTKERIADTFDRMNVEYFSGKLRKPIFATFNGRRKLGYCTKSVIGVTDYYDFDERLLTQIILHEMVHWYIKSNGIKDVGHHGKVFKSIADRINKKGGWSISRTEKLIGVPLRVHRTWNICAFRTCDGRHFMFAYCNGREPYFKHIMHKNNIKDNDIAFVVSDDSYLCSTLTECRRRVRGRYIDKSIYNKLMSANK